MGAGFFLVGRGRLDTLLVPLARRHRLYGLSDPDRRCSVHFLAQVERRLAGFAMEYQRVASAIPPAAPCYFRDNIFICARRRLNLFAK